MAEMVGGLRERTASMISLGSMPWRYAEVVPRSECPSWRWMMLTATPSRASSTAWAWRSWWGANRRLTPASMARWRSSARAAVAAHRRPRV